MTTLSKDGQAAVKQRHSNARGYRRLAVIAAVFVLLFTAIPFNLISDNEVSAESIDGTYTVSYNTKYKDGQDEKYTELSRENYYPGDIVTVSFDPIPHRSFYFFLGWALTADAKEPDFKVTPYIPTDASWTTSDPLDGRTFQMGHEDVKLYAVWGSETYTVSLNLGDETIIYDEGRYFLTSKPKETLGNYIAVIAAEGSKGRLNISRTALIGSADQLYILLVNVEMDQVSSAININPHCEVVMQFQGSNTLSSSNPTAAVLRVPEQAKLILMGQEGAKLTITKNSTGLNPSGAGIGGNGGTTNEYPPESSGLIQIESGNIEIKANVGVSGQSMCITGIGGGGFGGGTDSGYAGKGGITTIYGGSIEISLTSETGMNQSTGVGGGSSMNGYANDSGLITIVNGNVDVLLSATTMLISGAGIGGGGTHDRKSGGDATVRIDGGTIRITKVLTAGHITGAGIGGGGSYNTSAGNGDVLINGGTIYVKHDASLNGANTTGAGIGGGGANMLTDPSGSGRVTVNEGNITVHNTGITSAAAIGGGNRSSGNVIVNGGTITAMSPSGSTIGGGNGGISYVQINGGTIKTAAPITCAVDKNKNVLVQRIFTSSGDVRSVFIRSSTVNDGRYADFNITSNHFEWSSADLPMPSVTDHDLYLYLPSTSTDASIENGSDGQVSHYAISEEDISLTGSNFFRVEFRIDGVVNDNNMVHAVSGGDFSGTLVSSGNPLPSVLRISAADGVLSDDRFTYDPVSGSLSVPNVNGKVIIRSGDHMSPYTTVMFMDGSKTISKMVMNVGGNLVMIAALPDDDTKELQFAGWKDPVKGIVYQPGSSFGPLPNQAESVFIAVWVDYMRISFDLNGGTGTFTDIRKANGTVIILPSESPLMDGYSFIGWRDIVTGKTYEPDSEITLTRDTVLIAVWNGNDVSVIFDLNGGEYKGDELKDKTAKVGSMFIIPNADPTRRGHNFLGWTLDEAGKGTVFRGGESVDVPVSDFTLYAKWTSFTTAAVFDLGKGMGIFLFLKGIPGTTAELPVYSGESLSGYTFAGWSLDHEAPETEVVFGDSDVTYHAIWKPRNDISVVFENHSTVSATLPDGLTGLVYGTTFTADPPTNLPKGVYFIGWNTEKLGNGTDYKEGLNPVPADSITLYAKWGFYVPVIFYLAGGSDPSGEFERTYIKPGSTFPIPDAEPIRDGYGFTGWYEPVNGITYRSGDELSVEGEITLIAQWEGNEITITYDLNGGKGSFVDNIGRVGSSFALPSAKPIKEGFYFTGWSFGGSVYEAGFVFDTLQNVPKMEFVAVWSEYPVLAFNLNGGNADERFDTIMLKPSDMHVLETPVRTGYKFLRWFDSATNKPYNAGEEISIKRNTTLTAEWIGNDIPITFNLNGGYGSGFDSTKGNVGSSFTMPQDEPKYAGHFFIGWSFGGSVYEAGFVFDTLQNVPEMDFIAVWSEYPVLAFNLNGGTPDPKFDTVKLAPSETHVLEVPVRAGYKFVRWFDNATATSYSASQGISITRNTTLTAEWEGNPVSIRYDVNGGSGDFPDAQGKVGSPYVLSGNIPVRDGHHFIGWSYLGSVFQPGHEFEQLPNVKAMEFIAVWSEHPTLSFNLNGGEPSSQFVTVSLGPGAIHVLAEPSRSGYGFVKWVDNATGTEYFAGDGISITRNTALTAIWEGNTVTITYRTGSDVFMNDTGRVGSPYTVLLDIPVKEGHFFMGWSCTGSVFQPGFVYEHLPNVSDVVLKALWSEYPMLSFNLNGGSNSPEFDTTALAPEASYRLSEPYRSGYRFIEWIDNATGSRYAAGYDISITRNTTLTAVWEGNPVSIKYDLNGGSGDFPDVQGKVGSLYVLYGNIPVRDGHHFIGWSYLSSVFQPGHEFEQLPNVKAMEFVAIWSEHPTLSFNLSGGEPSPQFVTVSLGPDAIHVLVEPSRPGYKFVRWIDATSGSGYLAGNEISIIRNTTLTAVWEGNTISIRYDLNGGSGTAFIQTEGKVGSSFVVLSDEPVKGGYFFTGWSYGNSVFQPGHRFEHLSHVSEMIFIAVWSENPLLVFNLNGGTQDSRFDTVRLGPGESKELEAPARPGHSFVKWVDNATGTVHTAGSGISITRNTTLTAVWEGNPVSIRYDVNGGSGDFPEIQSKVGSLYVLSDNIPVRNGHHFIGWSYLSSLFQPGHEFEQLPNVKAMEFIAVWSEHPTLSFNLNGGSNSPEFDTIALASGVKYTLAEPSRPGYRFVKWVDNATGSRYAAGYDMSITRNTTLTAVWEGNPVSIRYDLNGGSGTAFIQTEGRVGSSFVVLSDEPVKEGYFFTGWSYGNSVFQPGYRFEHLPHVSEMVFTAVWSENPLLAFNLNGGEPSSQFDTVSLASGVKYTLAEPSRPGYRFIRWVDVTSGSGYFAGNEISIIRNTTLKAEWEGNPVSIKYDLNGGTRAFEDTFGKVGSSYTIPSNVPVRNGHHFVGWSYLSSVLQPGHEFEQLPNVSEMLFVAIWSEHPTLSFDLNGGTPDQKFSTISLGPGDIHVLAGPFRNGYRFVGWTDNAAGVTYQPGDGISIVVNTILIAVWAGNEIPISYDLNGGSGDVFESTKGKVGSPFRIPQEEPIFEGHHFVGWFFGGLVYGAGFVFDSLQNVPSMTFIATWSQYPMLSFNLNGGIPSSEFDTVSLSHGAEYTLGKPSRTGYRFVEWVDIAAGRTYLSGDSISITENTTLSAVWIGNEVMVSYDLNGGSGDVFENVKGNVGTVFEIPAEEPIKEGYHFAGWSFGGSVYEAGFVFDPLPNFLSIRFVAIWSEYPMLSFDLQGGSCDGFGTMKERPGTDMTLPSAEPVRPGYSFGGWQNIRTGEVYQPGDTISITISTVMTAVWNGSKITVTYHTDAGEAPSPDVYTFDGSFYMISWPTETMVKPGHEFALWKDGNGNIYRPGAAVPQFTSNTELTAVWAPVSVPESYTIVVTMLPGVPGGTIEYRIGNSEFLPYTGAVQVLPGDDITFRATADQRSLFKQWTYNGEIFKGDTITISAVTSSASILAEFEQDSNDHMWILYLLLLILPISAVIWAYRRKGQ